MPGPQHTRGEKAAREWLRSNGYTEKPVPKTGKHEADVYGEWREAKQGGSTTVHKRLIEVEDEDSLYEQHAKEQSIDFGAWAGEYGSRKAVLFVPAGHETNARRELPLYDLYLTYE